MFATLEKRTSCRKRKDVNEDQEYETKEKREIIKGENDIKNVHEKEIMIQRTISKEPEVKARNYVVDAPKRCSLALQKDVFGDISPTKKRKKKSIFDKIKYRT